MNGPALRYYSSLVGAWRGSFSFEITNETRLRADCTNTNNARLLRWMARMSRLMGPATMHTTLVHEADSAPTFAHTTRVTVWAVSTFVTRERILLAQDGHSLEMRGEQQRLLGPRTTYEATGEVTSDAVSAKYHIPWFGVALVQTTRIHEGDLELEQRTPFSRGFVRLVRQA